MASLLRVHGCDVATAASGPAALQALETGLRPCLMLLDLSMPDMDGWEVWDRMRAHKELQATPVVILSGESPDTDRARAVGIRAFLQKPQPAPDILEAVEQYCRVASTLPPPTFDAALSLLRGR
jgi:putative two-component system response regulator